MNVLAAIKVTPTAVILNGKQLETEKTGDALLTECYRGSHADYPKYFKMDGMCRLGFVASELLLQSVNEERFVPREDRAVILASHHGCLSTDRNYQQTIQDKDNYFPSPALFVYTLPNIVTGEIAIRNKYLGETSMYLIEEDEQVREEQMCRLEQMTFLDPITRSALIGWVDYENNDHFEATLKLVSIE